MYRIGNIGYINKDVRSEEDSALKAHGNRNDDELMIMVTLVVRCAIHKADCHFVTVETSKLVPHCHKWTLPLDAAVAYH